MTEKELFKQYVIKNFQNIKRPNSVLFQTYYCEENEVGFKLKDLLSKQVSLEEAKRLLYNHFIKLKRNTPKKDASYYLTSIKMYLDFKTYS